MKEFVDDVDGDEEDADDEADEADEDDNDDEEKEFEAVEASETFVLDASVLKEFAKIVEARLDAKLDGLEIDMEGVTEKESPVMVELKDAVDSLTKKVEALTDLLGKTDKERLKEMLSDAPRSGKLRVMRFKSQREEDLDDELEEKEDDEEMMGNHRSGDGVVIRGADGKTVGSMTEFLTAR